MTGELDRLERAVEQQMHLLADLPAESLRPECMARVKAAVVAEAGRLGAPVRAWRGLPRWLSIAATLLLAVGLTQVFKGGRLLSGSPAEGVELLEMWVSAVDESNNTLMFLLDEGWVLNGAKSEADEQTEIEDFLKSLEQTFEDFETM